LHTADTAFSGDSEMTRSLTRIKEQNSTHENPKTDQIENIESILTEFGKEDP